MFEHLNKVLLKPTLKVLDEVRSRGNARQARDLEQGRLNVGKNYLLLVDEKKNLGLQSKALLDAWSGTH